MLELPTELDRLETNQALLVTKRALFMQTATNQTNREREDFAEVKLMSVFGIYGHLAAKQEF